MGCPKCGYEASENKTEQESIMKMLAQGKTLRAKPATLMDGKIFKTVEDKIKPQEQSEEEIRNMIKFYEGEIEKLKSKLQK